MTHSVGRQSGAPFVSGPGATNNVTKNFTGGSWTFTRTAVAGAAEGIATFKTSDDAVARLEIHNATTVNGVMIPTLSGYGSNSGIALAQIAVVQTDTGSTAAVYFDSRTEGGTAIATRPLFGWYNNGTQQAMLSAGGVFSLGGTTSTLYSRLGQKLEANTSANYGGAALNTWSTTAGERSLLDFNRSKSATVGTHAVVASGDSLGDIVWRGSDGTAFIDGAGILAAVDGTPGTNDMPTRLIFQTTPDGSASRTERMRITNAGDVGVGKTPTTGIILDVNGQLGLKSYTVATLPSASVQAGAIVYASDAGGNGPCLVISNGTNWKRCDNTSTTVS